jgi:UDP-N-acetylmuramoyl-tripeptide--D-alanyl-D-alanine ligase
MSDPVCFEQRVTGMITTEDIVAATGGKVVCVGPDSFTGVSIDSRNIREGELFVALKGDRFDGHDFLSRALDKGRGAIVDLRELEPVKGRTIICVEDTLGALQALARYLRSKRDLPVVAVTGSNGKTTTKEVAALILGTKYRVLKNAGNLNNHIGLPLSLTNIGEEDEVAVIEMGASAPGEIKGLCDIAAPDYGVLTNISPAHLRGFGDIEAIRKTKLELLGAVEVAIVNADDLFMMEGVQRSAFRGPVIRYGIDNPADVRASDIRLHDRGSSFALHIPGGKAIEVNPKISGLFNIYNLLAAASVGHLFNVGETHMKTAIDSFAGVPMRLEFRTLREVTVISDMYNANPASMEQALKELVRIRKSRAIAVLGDMLELGTFEEEAHRGLGRLMSGLSIDIFLAVGPLMGLAASEFRGRVYKLGSPAEAGRLLWSIGAEGDAVLIKGSRGMGMEKVLEEYAL